MDRDNELVFMDALLYAMEGKNPSQAIENQEKKGQREVVRNLRLPKKLNDMSVPHDIRWNNVDDSMEFEEKRKVIDKNNIDFTRKQYERMGIVIESEYDDLFWNVTLPDGWNIKATEHSMWNDLFDDKGRKRANFFYKAAFYDRDAFINFNTRFRIGVEHIADPSSDYEVWKKSDFQGVVSDGDKPIFKTECVKSTEDYSKDDKIKNMLRDVLVKFVNENYPDYEDIHSYWD